MTLADFISELSKLDRYDVEIGGCGDPECCGSYLETTKREDGDYIKTEDILILIEKAVEGK